MKCQTCHGTREVPVYQDGVQLAVAPCLDCLGGEQHCCEGEQCQPTKINTGMPSAGSFDR